MAEIKIEKKKQVWPWWVGGILILAFMVYFLMFRDADKNPIVATDGAESVNTEEVDLLSVKENNIAVTAYVSFIENGQGVMSLDHAYTNEAFMKLVAATEAMAYELGFDVQAEMNQVKEYANSISSDPFETTHADNIRNADILIARALERLQQAKYPSLAGEVGALKTAAESIKPGVLTLDQKDAVKDFFAKASDLLKKMN